MEGLAEKAGMLAGEHYKKGINCAEALVMTFDELCNLGIGPSVRMASCFGGGIGHSEDICGALSGSIMVLGALAGRPNPPEGDRERMYAFSKGFHDKFTALNQRTDCKYLRKFEFGQREQRITCMKLICSTASLLAEYLLETGLVKA